VDYLGEIALRTQKSTNYFDLKNNDFCDYFSQGDHILKFFFDAKLSLSDPLEETSSFWHHDGFLYFKNYTNKEIRICIRDIQGRKLQEGMITAIKNVQEYKLPYLKKGIYMVQIEVDNQTSYLKIFSEGN